MKHLDKLGLTMVQLVARCWIVCVIIAIGGWLGWTLYQIGTMAFVYTGVLVFVIVTAWAFNHY